MASCSNLKTINIDPKCKNIPTPKAGLYLSQQMDGVEITIESSRQKIAVYLKKDEVKRLAAELLRTVK